MRGSWLRGESRVGKWFRAVGSNDERLIQSQLTYLLVEP
jgi:hypothetical protein